MNEDSKAPLLLGRPFLETSRDLIFLELGHLFIRIQYEDIIFDVFKVMSHYIENPQCYCIDVVEDTVEEYSQSESPLLPIKCQLCYLLNGLLWILLTWLRKDKIENFRNV